MTDNGLPETLAEYWDSYHTAMLADVRKDGQAYRFARKAFLAGAKAAVHSAIEAFEFDPEKKSGDGLALIHKLNEMWEEVNASPRTVESPRLVLAN